MRREDLERISGPDGDAPGGAAAPPTLEAALRVPDLDDDDLAQSLWDDLVSEAPVLEAAVAPRTAPPRVEPLPAAEPAGAPVPAVAPPPGRTEARRLRREAKDLARVEKLRLRRHRVLPRTVLGIASMLLCFGLGVGVAGAVLYAYYDWRLTENEQRVGELSESLERRLQEANEELNLSSDNAVRNIREESRHIRALVADQQSVTELTGQLDGSVWFVETLDENGAASVGSAFVAASDDAQSLLVTSFAVVAAGTTEPAPAITVRSGDESFDVEVYNWDPENDLALLRSEEHNV